MGGCGSSSVGLSDTEFLTQDLFSKRGPEMPWNSNINEGLCEFCAVQLDDTHTFITGGKVRTTNGVFHVGPTFIFDHETNTWTQKTFLNNPRIQESSALFFINNPKDKDLVFDDY